MFPAKRPKPKVSQDRLKIDSNLSKSGTHPKRSSTIESPDEKRTKNFLDLCQEGDVKALKNFTSRQYNTICNSINTPLDKFGNTALHFAVAEGDHLLTFMLLLKGADPNIPNKSGITPIVSARRGHYDKIEAVLQRHGAVLPPYEEKNAKRLDPNHGLTAGATITLEKKENLNPTLTGPSLPSSLSIEMKRNPASQSSLNTALQSKNSKLHRADTALSTTSGSIPSRAATNKKQNHPTNDKGNTMEDLETKLLLFKGASKRRPGVFKFCKPRKIPCHQAAYLGFADALMDVYEDSEVNSVDEYGCTGLMKAAYAGHAKIVSDLISKGADVYAVDNEGNTALVWACLAGKLKVVEILVNEGKADINGPERASHKKEGSTSRASVLSAQRKMSHVDDQSSIKSMNALSPLIAATFGNHVDIVKYLVSRGADVNKQTGPGAEYGKGKTAIMMAAWMLNVELVDFLLTQGAQVEATNFEWIKRGVIALRRMSLDHSAWRMVDENAGTNPVGSPSSGLDMAVSPEPTRDSNLREKIAYLTAEDLEIIGRVVSLISPPTGAPSTSVPVSKKLTDDEDADTKIVPRKKNLRRTSFFRQALNLEKVLGSNPSSIYNIQEAFPEKGTDLDAKCLVVFQCAIQLVMAANKNIKHQYVVISAKAVHYTAEIIHAIEHMEKMMANATGISSRISENDVFPGSLLRARIKDTCQIITEETSKQLMLTTRIAVGVWPPPNSVSEMIKAAIALANACKELVDLANVLGFFPTIDKPLEMQFEPYSDGASEENGSGTSAETSSSSQDHNKMSLAALNYSEYKRKNQLKEMEEMSKMYDSHRTTIERESWLAVEQDPFKKFDTCLDTLLVQLVTSVAEVKRVHSQHLTEEYITTISAVAACTEAVLDEIEASEPFSKNNDTALMMDYEDLKQIESKSLQLNLNPHDIPMPFKNVISKIQTEIRSSTRTLLYKGKIASGDFSPPNASIEMLQATVPCLVGVKKVVTVAKLGAAKYYKNTTEEGKKRAKWRREWVQNERVKKMFQVWEAENKEEDSDSFKQSFVTLTPEEIKFLEDSTEGLVLEDTLIPDKPKILKGGELHKIVAWTTSHAFLDVDLVSSVLMTHHSFTTSVELLDAFVRRYSMTPPYGLNQRMFEIYVKRKIVPIRLRVCNVMKHWLENYFEGDFLQNETLVLYFRDFVETKIALDFESMAKTLLKLLEEKLNIDFSKPTGAAANPFHNTANTFMTLASETAVRHHLATDPTTFYEYLDPMDMAKQMTCIDFDLFVNVKPHECLDQIWGERRKKELKALNIKSDKINSKNQTTGIVRMIQHTNHLTMWVATKILSSDNLKARVSALKYFAQTALCCREINNFNGVTGIVAGLSMAPVLRLYKTWGAFQEKYPKISESYKEVAELVSPKGQYGNYRKALKELKPPAIPFLGVYLTDLTFIELGNPGFLPDTHYINFEKRRKVFTLIREIQFYQQVPYLFPAVPIVQDILQSLGNVSMSSDYNQVLMTEEQLYDTSLAVEPRLEEDEDE